MSDAEEQAREIQSRMAALRRDLDVAVEETAATARQWSDWHYYVRRFPWATAGIALAAGYLIVPKKQFVMSPDPETLAEMSRRHQVFISQKPETAKSNSVVGKILVGVGLAAARAGAAYMSEKMNAKAADDKETAPWARAFSASVPK